MQLDLPIFTLSDLLLALLAHDYKALIQASIPLTFIA